MFGALIALYIKNHTYSKDNLKSLKAQNPLAEAHTFPLVIQ